MSNLASTLQEYLGLRRGLGFKLRDEGTVLVDFVSFLEQQGVSTITTQLALRWAVLPQNVEPAHWARRLSMVRLFAQYRSASDPRTEIPPKGLLPHRYRRRPPYIYSDREIRQLIKAAKKLPSTRGLRPETYSTLFGLLVVTGMRIFECLTLNNEDVDMSQGVLTIRQTKFRKSRLVLIHESTQRRLRQYVRRRDRVHPKPSTQSFFVSDHGARLTRSTVRWTFIRLSHQIGLRSPSDRHGPRLHDFRHAFAVRTLLAWYRQGVDVE
jgi:integrase/recombinase XerD